MGCRVFVKSGLFAKAVLQCAILKNFNELFYAFAEDIAALS